jgi:hypothetical protein
MTKKKGLKAQKDAGETTAPISLKPPSITSSKSQKWPEVPAPLTELIFNFCYEHGYREAGHHIRVETQKREKTGGYDESCSWTNASENYPSIVEIFNEWQSGHPDIRSSKHKITAEKAVLVNDEIDLDQKDEDVSSSSSSSSSSSNSEDSDDSGEEVTEGVELSLETAALVASDLDKISSSGSDSDSSSSSSDSNSDSDSDSEGKAGVKVESVVETKLEVTKVEVEEEESSSESESNSDSDASSSESESEGETRPKTIPAQPNPLKRKAPASSSSASDSEGSSTSDSESSDSDDEPAPKKTKVQPVDETSSSDSDSDSSSSESDAVSTPAGNEEGKPVRADSSESSVTLARTSPDTKPTSTKIKSEPITDSKQKPEKPNSERFRRVPDNQPVDPKFSSNAYQSYNYADKAYKDLSVTKGKGFTKEKNKKKRGSYRGGMIDSTGVNSIKFDD